MYVMQSRVVLLVDCVPDFRNPEDPDDKSFEPHPTDYPVVDLEFPNTGACERSVPAHFQVYADSNTDSCRPDSHF